MSRQFWTEALAWTTADGAAVASTSETINFPNVTIPASYLQDGRQLESWQWGRYSSTTGPPTVTFRQRWNGVAGTITATSGAITCVASQTNAIWMVYLRLVVRSNGSSGTVFCMGMAILFNATAPTVGSATGAPGIAPMSQNGITAPAVATIDMTADTALAHTIQHSSASNASTGHNYFLDSPN